MNQLSFDNRFIRELPADPIASNQCRQVLRACYSRVQPRAFERPSLVASSPEVAALLDISPEESRSERFIAAFSGRDLLPGMEPYATCYGGHQFGNWAGQLGDGRAINLGELVNSQGQRWALQLKGAGPTPYSRRGDGFAVLRSSLREFLCSEAMHHLGVPTTRALSLILSGEDVVRDMFYDGRAKAEPGAVVCRVAPSFTRFGHFELFANRGDHQRLRQLVDYTIRTDFPELGEPCNETIVEWLRQVAQRSVAMIVHWLRVGFVHGVMNTDNMSIFGLTIDYGPYGWLDVYDPEWTPNTTDAMRRRYRFGNQAKVAQWNLLQLANAIYQVVDASDALVEIVEGVAEELESQTAAMMASKLGLSDFKAEADSPLLDELAKVLCLRETDMTLFFRLLAELDITTPSLDDNDLLAPLAPAYYDAGPIPSAPRARILAWLKDYRARAKSDPEAASRRQRMNQVNPKYVLRNYLAQEAIELAESGDFSRVEELLELLKTPYDEQPEREQFAAKRPEWARHKPGCSTLSCSS